MTDKGQQLALMLGGVRVATVAVHAAQGNVRGAVVELDPDLHGELGGMADHLARMETCLRHALSKLED